MSLDTSEPHPATFWCRTLGALGLYPDSTDPRPLMEAGKPLATLVYLALAPGGKAKRDHVAELLWPGSDLTEARHSLRQSLYRLRHATGGVPLVHLRGTELVLQGAARFDCLEGERIAGDGELPRAYELLRGNFLEGFSIPESCEFESWTEAQRIRFRDAWAHAAAILVERSLAAGDAARALEVAEELATLRPFNDGPARLVMAAFVAAGRHAAAVARYHAHVELMRRELDAEPDKELAAYARELEGYLKSRPEPSAAVLPFVGRSKQWSVLEAAWEAAQGRRGTTILVEGAAGLGKSRLIDELTRRVRGAGGVALLGKCYDIERAVPYAAVADGLAPVAIRSEIGGLSPAWLAEAARLLPELQERFPGLPNGDDPGGSPAAKRRLHQAVARCLEAVAEDAPVLFAVDDVHWADGPSLEMLHFLSHRLRETKVVLVASYRPAELSPVARQFARSLCAGKLAELLVLGPLAAADVADLLGTLGRFDDPVAGATLALHLARHTGGSPLFLNEVLAVLARTRVLLARDGCWQVSGPSAVVDLPHTLGKLMADRIDALAPWMRACLETIAVAAAETPVEVLAQALQVSEPRAELALAVLEEERVVKRAGADTFELVHDELRRLVYQGIPDERRRLLHAAVGSALESRGEAKRPGGAARLAFHFDQAGLQEPAHRYALAAAGEAEALAAPGERRAHLEVAEAHAPKALPPAARVEGRGVRGFLRRHGLVAAGAALLALLSAAGGYLYAPALGGAAGYSQGTIYLSSGDGNPSHRLRWPVRRGQLASVEPLRGRQAGYRTPLVVRNVTASNETHVKVFAVRGADTAQLTFGSSDDYQPRWAPDERAFLLIRGWRASETRYQQNAFLMDSVGRVVRQLTNSPWQDLSASWSPAGTRLTFRRDASGVPSIWVADADGANESNVTERFGLPRVPAYSAFAPDDHRVAVVYADTGSQLGAAYVVDLAEKTVRPLPGIPPAIQLARPLWSPDGRWLAYMTRRGDAHGLWVVSVDGVSGPVLVAEFTSLLYPHDWRRGSRRWAARVVLGPEVVAVGTGRGTRVSARVLAPDGEVVSSVLRWSVEDTAIARVDDLGFVRGRSPGTTQLVASAGGFRADTVLVTVAFAPVDTLFDEGWSRGLDSTRWTPFGYPRPLVVHGVPPDGRSTFLNNGDYNHGSGAVSVQTFEVGDAGLTLETEAWLPFTGQHWQNWQTALAHEPFADGGLEVFGGPVSIGFSGPSPTIPGPLRSCSDGGAQEEPQNRIARWRRGALVVRPDGWSECWVDGRLIGARPLPDGLTARPMAIVLRGMSVGTRIYHGRVVVTRGLRH